jgi:hypothetical protein
LSGIAQSIAARIALLATMLAPMPAVAEQVPTLALPVIDVTPVEGGLRVEGRVLGLGDGTVDANLSLTREDGSGRTATRQSREISVTAGSNDVVASTQLSAGEDTRLDVTLVLRSVGSVFAQAQIRLAPDDDLVKSQD